MIIPGDPNTYLLSSLLLYLLKIIEEIYNTDSLTLVCVWVSKCVPIITLLTY